MKLIIKRPIPMLVKHPDIPEWIFVSNNSINPQTISLDEEHMKELLSFFKNYAVHFNEELLEVSIVTFSDIILTFDPLSV